MGFQGFSGVHVEIVTPLELAETSWSQKWVGVGMLKPQSYIMKKSSNWGFSEQDPSQEP